MSKVIEIRNVPDELYRLLRTRATQAGMSLSDYLLNELRRAAELPTRQEMLRRLKSRTPVDLSTSIVEAIREDRDTR